MTEHIRSLPPPFTTSPENFQLITQGAEALVYKTSFLSPDCPAALKIRPIKTWRHPTLDKRLTKQRITAEARVLVKCLREGIQVPRVLGADWEFGWLALEWIEGRTVKQVIRERKVGVEQDEEGLVGLLRRIGEVVGGLHAKGVVHGDLTTSNMMVRPATARTTSSPPGNGEEESGEGGSSLEGDIVLIDFGLASQSATQEEDRAVDIYVLERAFGSTHPKEEELFGEVLKAYGSAYKGAKSTLKRLEDVRMRGRKKSMLG